MRSSLWPGMVDALARGGRYTCSGAIAGPIVSALLALFFLVGVRLLPEESAGSFVAGVETTLAFGRELIDREDFRAGEVFTTFIAPRLTVTATTIYASLALALPTTSLRSILIVLIITFIINLSADLIVRGVRKG